MMSSSSAFFSELRLATSWDDAAKAMARYLGLSQDSIALGTAWVAVAVFLATAVAMALGCGMWRLASAFREVLRGSEGMDRGAKHTQEPKMKAAGKTPAKKSSKGVGRKGDHASSGRDTLITDKVGEKAASSLQVAASAPPASGTPPSDEAPRHRSRPLNHEAPTSTIRGFPTVDVLETSPCQRFLAIVSRRKMRANIYPQNTNRSFMGRGKELQEKYFVNVGDALESYLGGRPAEVSKLVFSGDGSHVAVGESLTDVIYVCSIDGRGKMSVVWTYKMPRNAVVSMLPKWGLGGDANDLIILMHDKDCVVEAIHSRHGAIGKDKFKIGNALTWAHAGKLVATSGSFMKESKVARIALRPDASAFTLHTLFQTSMAAAGNNSALRVTAVALVTKGAPEINTRSYLVTFMEDGNGYVYDMSGERRQELEFVGQFSDPDFAGYSPNQPLNMTTCITGSSYHERLSVALWRGGDVSVHCQDGPTVNDGKPFHLKHTKDLHDAHDGGVVARVCFIQHGHGLATSGNADERHVRLWALPPPS